MSRLLPLRVGSFVLSVAAVVVQWQNADASPNVFGIPLGPRGLALLVLTIAAAGTALARPAWWSHVTALGFGVLTGIASGTREVAADNWMAPLLWAVLLLLAYDMGMSALRLRAWIAPAASGAAHFLDGGALTAHYLIRLLPWAAALTAAAAGAVLAHRAARSLLGAPLDRAAEFGTPAGVVLAALTATLLAAGGWLVGRRIAALALGRLHAPSKDAGAPA